MDRCQANLVLIAYASSEGLKLAMCFIRIRFSTPENHVPKWVSRVFLSSVLNNTCLRTTDRSDNKQRTHFYFSTFRILIVAQYYMAQFQRADMTKMKHTVFSLLLGALWVAMNTNFLFTHSEGSADAQAGLCQSWAQMSFCRYVCAPALIKLKNRPIFCEGKLRTHINIKFRLAR